MATDAIITWFDHKGAESTTRLHLGNEDSIAAAADVVGAFLPLAGALSGAAVRGVSIVADVGRAGYPRLVPVDTNDVEKKATFIFGTAVGTESRFSIPSYNELYTLALGRNLNPLATEVANLIIELTSGAYTDINQQSLTLLLDAYEDYRGRKRGRK